jgi:hypothetical protein
MSLSLEKRAELIQSVSDRLCGAFDKSSDFSKELNELLNNYPLDYKVNYQPSTFKLYEFDSKGNRVN